MTRDVWSDAHQAATAEVLDGELVAARRRLRVRRAVGLVLGGTAFVAPLWLIDPDVDVPWPIHLQTPWVSFGLVGLGFVLVIVGAARTSAAARPFVGPDAFLTRDDRTWLRTQIATGRPVPDGRHAVVSDAARGMVVEGRYLPTYLGLTLVYLGMLVGGPSLGTLVGFSALITWMVLRIVRGALWSRRARRWLAQHA